MAAVLEKNGYRCAIKDYPMEERGWGDLKSDIEKGRPSLLVLSATMATIKEDLKACGIAKAARQGCVTAAKGGYVADNSESLLKLNKDLDIFINSEPEFVIEDIARSMHLESIRGISFRRDDRIFNNQARPFDGDLDSLPRPARHLIKNELYRMPDTKETFTTILTGRGCPFQCIYCLAGKVGGDTLRLRSPSNIMGELSECVGSLGIQNFWIRADTFTFNKKWVIELCRALIDSGLKIKWMTNSRVDMVDDEMLGWMKAAGCTTIGFGAESGNQFILDMMKKGIKLEQTKAAVDLCRKKGIKTYLNFIIGLPWEDEDTFNDTIKFAKLLKADMYNFSLSYPFPGTELYEFVKKNNLLCSEKELMDLHGFFEPVVGTLFMTKKRLASLKAAAFRKVMLNPAFIMRTARNINSPAVLVNYAKEAMRLLRVIYGKGGRTDR
jgi:radical SAM superfamily enzyme YgiQ (UPF0313 family)